MHASAHMLCADHGLKRGNDFLCQLLFQIWRTGAAATGSVQQGSICVRIHQGNVFRAQPVHRAGYQLWNRYPCLLR